MSALRRHLPAAAALLAVLITVQATDLIVCADESEAHRTDVQTDVGYAQGAHVMPVPGDAHSGSHHSEEGPDCLCHIMFTPTAVVPTVGTLRAPEPAEFGAYVAAPTEVELMGLDHVPLS